MLQFILRRLGLVIPTFIGITLLTFAFVHMIPGDPVMIMAGERGISPERHAQLLAEMGLDKPLWQQYAHYIWGVLHGDLGISLKSRIPVWQEFVPRFKATLELGVCAMIFAVAVGIPVGVLAAVKRGSIFDHTAVGLALTGYSMPIFWWGMMLIMLVSVQLNLTPVSGRISDTVFLDDTLPLTGFMLIDTAIWGEQGDFIDALMHMILPAIVLGTHPAGGDCAYDPFVDAGSARRRLYSYRARQRADPDASDCGPRAAQRDAASGHGHWPAGGHAAGGRHPDGNHFLMAWFRPLADRRAAAS